TSDSYMRNHGGKLFIDLADRYGTTQLVFEGKKALNAAGSIGKEFVLRVRGNVKRRDPDTVDKDNPTGTVELYVEEVEIINRSLVPPFEIIEEKQKFLANEELRMKYRYLDLRRTEMVKRIEFRDKLTKSVRQFFWDKGFLELETPTLVKDTYETGSRTFLVPSRTKKGSFYSLPQSPQIYKQLCMIAGLDKYFQMARCYRDEDPREDRQPEFTQIDVEVSFKDEKYIQGLVEELFVKMFNDVLHKQLKAGFRHMDYWDAVNNYGSDKPDLRFDSKIVDITDEAMKSGYNILKRVVDSGGRVKAMAFHAGFGSAESRIDKNYMLKTIALAQELGLKGLTWLFVKDKKLASDPETIAESLKSVSSAMLKKMGAKDGDIIIICSDASEQLLLSAMGKLRKAIGDKIGYPGNEFEFLWIDNFPLFERDEVTGKLKPAHNPFTAPTEDTAKLMESHPEKVLARQYDLVLNGIEIASGSIRIRDPEQQRKSLRLMGMSDSAIDGTFGFLIEALGYGAPIEGGIALGYDRIIATLYGSGDMREFILFPKNKKYESLVDGSPTPINTKRLITDFGFSTER
ncbi:MAG: aspartate--tRNA ligase, partial [Candidatus Marsarchaeota archaeon]|nr:aspartate--tRNA ligase [Candidatus Marsarchaeota archaeon]